MGRPHNNLQGNSPPQQLPLSTYVWAVSAFGIGLLYALLLGLLSAAFIITIYFYFFLIVTLPALALAIGFVRSARDLLRGRLEARVPLRDCAGTAVAVNFALLLFSIAAL